MLCRFFQQGACRFGDQCRYAHQPGGSPGGGKADGAYGGFDGKGKGHGTSVCPFFMQGSCRFGEACRNSHDLNGGGGGGKKGKGKKGKGAKKGNFRNVVWTPQGQGCGKGDYDDYELGKGPSGLPGPMGAAPPPPGAVPGVPNPKALTGPYLGKGSELLKVWCMPEDQGHEDSVLCAIAMDDRVCTGGADYKLMLWRGDQQGGGLVLAFDNESAFSAAVTALMWHSSSKFLFCGLEDGQIQAFRQQPLASLTVSGHTAAVTSMLIHEGVLLSGSMDASVRAWKYDDAAGAFSCVATVPIPLGPAYALHLRLPDVLLVGAQQGLCVLSLQSLQPAGQVDAVAPVVALLPYQGSVIAAFANGVIKVFDTAGVEQFSHGPLGEHVTNTAAAIVQHPGAGKDLLLCGQELGYVTAYDLPEFRPRGTFTTGYEDSVAAIVDMSGGIFATFGHAGDVVIWRWGGA